MEVSGEGEHGQDRRDREPRRSQGRRREHRQQHDQADGVAAVSLERGALPHRHAPGAWQDAAVDVLAARVLLRSADPDRSRRFYRDVLGLAVAREFGPPDHPGLVFFLGGGFLEVSGGSKGGAGSVTSLWLQVRDLAHEHERLVAVGVPIVREPRQEPWGLREMWLADPDGVRLVLVEVPVDHPLRRDVRPDR